MYLVFRNLLFFHLNYRSMGNRRNREEVTFFCFSLNHRNFLLRFLTNSIIGSTIYVVNVGEEGIKNLDFPFTRILVDGFPQIGAGSCDEIFESFLFYFSIATIREEKKKRKIG